MACMKLKVLQQHLQDLELFEQPKVCLEQYATLPHIAGPVLHTIQSSFGDLEGLQVADFGCGCGVLAIGAVLLGAEHCLSIDIDPDALAIHARNNESMDINTIDLLQADVLQLGTMFSARRPLFDTVIMNPPFGTKQNRGADLQFVRMGLDLASRAVYSLHKTSTRSHVLAKAKQWNVKAQVLAQLRYDLPRTYKFHKKQSLDIEVDFIRFSF